MKRGIIVHKSDHPHRFAALLLGVAVLISAGWASADPPARVARLGFAQGAVSFSPAGDDQWVQATVNRPLVTGDRLWTDAGARTELQVGNAAFRMSSETSVTLLNLDDRVAQLQLSQGTLNVRLRRTQADDVFEVDTPNLAFSIRAAGEYRIEVDPAGNATAVVVRSGQGEVYGEGASYVVDAQHSYRFMGTGLREYEQIGAPQQDAFDRWAIERDRRSEVSVSARYVSPDVIGYEDLDANGTWRVEGDYGNVWVPRGVPAGWAPYHDGHWAWVDPWGWTWVDDAPWGFAVSHYGRWAFVSSTWCWVPGPAQVRAVYAPALVAFVGGGNFALSLSVGNVGIAWFPLGPRDVYRPAYAVSRGYFENINRSNTVINTTQITNVYNNNVTNITYANQRVPGAIVAVPTTAFAQSRPVAQAAVRVTPQTIANAPVAQVAAIAPVQASLRGAAQAVPRKPPEQVAARPVVVRNAPPAPPPAFTAQQQQLAAKPGVPLDTNARAALKPAPSAAAAPVRVVTAQQAPKPTSAPPAAPPGRLAQPATAPGAKGEQAKIEAPKGEQAKAEAPKGEQAKTEPPKGEQAKMQPPKAEQAKTEPPKGEQRGAPPANVAGAKQDQRPERMTSPLGTSQNGVRPAETPRGPPESRTQTATAPQSVPKPPVTAPPETRGPPESRTQTATAPQSVPRPPVTTPPETRGPPESRTQSAMAPQSAARPPAVATPPAPPAQRATPEKATPEKPLASKPPPPAVNAPQPPQAERSAAAGRGTQSPPPPAAAERRPPEGKPADAKGEPKNPKQEEERNRNG